MTVTKVNAKLTQPLPPAPMDAWFALSFTATIVFIYAMPPSVNILYNTHNITKITHLCWGGRQILITKHLAIFHSTQNYILDVV